MHKRQLIIAVAIEQRLTDDVATRTVNAVLAHITEALARGDSVVLTGFGTFRPRRHASGRAHRLDTREVTAIPARTVAVFTAGDRLRRAVR